jgi:hypothetical protein
MKKLTALGSLLLGKTKRFDASLILQQTVLNQHFHLHNIFYSL